MYLYFCSTIDCVLKIDGAFFGRLYDSPKLLRTDKINNNLLEVCFLDGKSPNINLILNNETLTNPPKNVIVTDLRGGYMLKFNYQKAQPYKMLCQKQFFNTRVTVCCDNTLKISIETNSDVLVEDLNFCADTASVFTFNQNGQNFVGIHLVGNIQLIKVYKLNNLKKIFETTIDSFCCEQNFTITQSFCDILKHLVTTELVYNNNTFVAKNKTVTSKKTYNIDCTREDVIPYLFFEEFLVGGNIEQFSAPSIYQNKNKLNTYLANYFGVITPPPFINNEYVGLIYKRCENVYYADYYKVEVKNKLVTNIVKT